MSFNFGTLEELALERSEQFLRPKSFLDKVFTLLLLFWFLVAIIFPQSVIFRATLFFSVIILFFVIPSYVLFTKEKEINVNSSHNRSFKILLVFIFIEILTLNYTIPNLWDPSFIPLSYQIIERTVICLAIPLSIIGTSFSPSSLNYGYLFYIQKIIQSVWPATIVLYLLRGIKIYIPVLSIPIDFDLLLLFGYALLLISNIIPVRIDRSKILTQTSTQEMDIFRQYQLLKPRIEKFRDALFVGSFSFLFFLWIKWVERYQDFIQYISIIGLIFGFILIFVPKDEKKNFSSILSSFSGKSIDPSTPLGNRVQNFAQTIQETSFKKPERIYSIPTEGLNLISKGKNTVNAKRGSLVVPTVTEKGTALVLMGKSELESKIKNTGEVIKKEMDGTSTLWISPEDWDKIKLKLIPKDIDELSKTELKEAGINSINDVHNSAKKAINDLKNWRGPKSIFISILDEVPSKYSITDTKEYTHVKMPGLLIFNDKTFDIAQVLGNLLRLVVIKGVGEYARTPFFTIIDIHKVFNYAKTPLFTIIETPDYTFAETPIFSIIETPDGEIARIFGFQIHGGTIDLAQMQAKIKQDLHKYQDVFTQRIEKLFDKDPHILLTKSKDETLGFLFDEEEILEDD